MARSIWSGSISFGLVNVPVKLYSAVSRKTVHFHQLHDADQARIQQQRVARRTARRSPYEHIVKGYEISPGRYVVIEPAELESVQAAKTKTIEVEQLRRSGRDRPDPLRPALLPDAGRRRGEGLPPDAGGDARVRQGGDRPRRAAPEGPPRRAAPPRRPADHGDARLRRRGGGRRFARGARQRGASRSPSRELAVARQLIEMLSGPVRRRAVPRRLPRRGARA